ncbi:MAG TPA: AAA family ATPase [Jatrophihabitantaceae bacterium]|jgi:DNA-binding CsgD family transcriptional regulator/Tfp pilus assembly protein PilF
MLRGRGSELRALERLIGEARAGRAGSLVLRGPPGVGKSALLAHAAAAADGMTVLRAAGVQTERDLPFSVLHSLFRPVLPLIERLPTRQRDAIRGALALGPPTGDDRFLVSAAVLSLLDECAGRDGLLCLLDDAHWMDRASLDALLFAARRLDADLVGLVFAVRDFEDQDVRDSRIDVIELHGLGRHDARALVAEQAGIDPADGVMTHLMHATAGNPLALTELATALDRSQLAGELPLPEPLPVSAGIDNAFLARARGLPDDTRRLLMLAAAEGTGDLATVLAAARHCGISADALAPAEDAGLVIVGDGTLTFRHELVRSALYGSMSSVDRRAIHAQLADVLVADSDTDRRTWHRAVAAVAPDDVVADELAASAQRARMRSGHAGAAAALHRSAALTSDPEARARRLVDAAENAWLAGKPELTQSCLDEARPLTSDAALGDQIARLRARWELRRGLATEAFHRFLAAALDAQSRDPDTAAGLFAEASEAALYVGDIEGMIRAGKLAAGATAIRRDGRFWRDYCVGVAEILQGRRPESEPFLRAVIDAVEGDAHPAELVSAGIAAVWLGDQGRAMTLYARAVQAARIADMSGNLPYVLEYLAATERTRGRYATSQAISEEGLRLSLETQQETSACNHLSNLAHLAALAGDEPTCRRYADETLARALPHELGFPAARASLAVAVLHLGLGRFAEALAALTELAAAGPGVGHPAIVMFSLPDRVEAAVRCGDLDAATAALRALERWSAHAALSARAVLLRCQAQLADDAAATTLYAEAMRLHASGHSPPPEVARTQLAYGEWLRRARRPAESRQQLRAAVETFDRLGSTPWAERARLELRASGETIPRPGDENTTRLTPQELRIARAVADGSSTKEIAALLFVSPRTVEYHLHKMFPKLGISSRADLIRLVLSNPALVER